MLSQIFDSRADFITYYLKEAGLGEECALFVQEEKTLEDLGLSSGKGKMWAGVLFSDQGLLYCVVYFIVVIDIQIKITSVPQHIQILPACFVFGSGSAE